MNGGLVVKAVAYVNHGRWIADCPTPYCGNALSLEPKQTMFHCSSDVGGCQSIAEVLWPSETEAIDAVLSNRPIPATRNWAPAGHRQAISCRVPDGQTVADLIAETIEHEVA